MRRPLLTVALAYAAGLLIGDQVPVPSASLLAAGLLLAFLTLAIARARPWLIGPLLAVTAWANLAARLEPLAPHDLRRWMGDAADYVVLRGRLVATPEQRVYEQREELAWRSLVELDVQAVQRGDAWAAAVGRVAISTPGVLGPEYFRGQRVQVAGVLRPPEGPLAEGLFDYRNYLKRRGVFYQFRAASTNDWQLVPSAGGPLRPPLADRFQAWAQRTLAKGLPVEDESLRLQWAMVLGWKTALTDEVSEPFMRSGTMHIFAISGLHVALIAGILVSLLRVIRVPRGLCGWLVVPAIWFYTAATGWQASAIRSTVMMTVIIVGWAVRRPGDLPNSLAGAAFIILIWDPQQLFQASFQLSFLVVLSIALLLPPLEQARQRLLRHDPLLPDELRPRWQRWLDRPIRAVTTSLATSLAAWLGSLPLVAFYFHLLTPVSLLANVVIVPLSSFALMCGLGSLVCGDWLPFLTECFNHAGWFWMTCMVKASLWATDLPGAYWYVPAPGALTLLLYYALLGALLSGWLLKSRRCVWAGVVLVVFLGIHAAQVWTGRHDVHLTVLPLRGGDSLYLDAPGRAEDLLIDAGEESGARLMITPFLHGLGVNRLPAMLLTHGDVRHVGGTSHILAEFRVRQLLTSAIRFRSPAYRLAVDNLLGPPVRRQVLGQGDTWGRWTVLHPRADDRLSQADDQALVLRGEFHGTRVLLCSDLGRVGQRRLLGCEANLRADIVVAGIPSGSEPLGEALLDAVDPQVIVLSAGAYPAREQASRTLRARLEQRGIPVFYTSDDGAVQLTVRPGGWDIRATRSGRIAPPRKHPRDPRGNDF